LRSWFECFPSSHHSFLISRHYNHSIPNTSDAGSFTPSLTPSPRSDARSPFTYQSKTSTGAMTRHWSLCSTLPAVSSRNQSQVPRTAVEAVRRRLSALSVPAREVASMAAVAGRRFDFTLLRTLTGHNELALLKLIKELVAAQLVTEESPDRFAFRHALTRAAI